MQILEHILKIRTEKAKQEFWQTVGNQLATIWHCEIGIAKLALRNWHCEIRKPQCTIHLSHKNVKTLAKFRIAKFAMWFAKFAIALPISQMHCEIRNLANRLRTDCEFRNPIKIPTVLPSDFVLRITFSSELRFRRFWYRWKA